MLTFHWYEWIQDSPLGQHKQKTPDMVVAHLVCAFWGGRLMDVGWESSNHMHAALGGELHVGGNSWIRHQGQEELLGASSKFGCNLGISPVAWPCWHHCKFLDSSNDTWMSSGSWLQKTHWNPEWKRGRLWQAVAMWLLSEEVVRTLPWLLCLWPK